jgi:hypothetical protein
LKKRLLLFLWLCGSLAAFAQVPGAPTDVAAVGYESHIELTWPIVSGATSYKIFRSVDGGNNYALLKQTNDAICMDWTGDEGQNLSRSYKIKASNATGDSDFSQAFSAQTGPMDDAQLQEMVQKATFRYFWDYGHPVSGMARERDNGNPDIITTGGSGFGILALVVGAERGWVTRAAAVERMVQIVGFLQFADRFHGVFPHWMDGNTGNVVPFSQYDNGADLVETAFLMQGLLTARQYFNQNDPQEKGLRDGITSLWQGVQWDWFRKNNGPVLYWHWSPNYAWQMNFPLRGFYEAQIVYILAAASPTHPVPGSLYQTGWTSSNYANYSSYYGFPIYCGPYGGGPMFFAHYSYLAFDPRNKKDAFCNYFTRNRNHALIQQKYCTINPKGHQGYSAECWGLTSSDDPLTGYNSHDMWPVNDNGTIAPTAALADMPYTPEESMAALKYFYRTKGETLWGPYGFYDAFNQNQNWVSNSYLAIDQGPIVAMIENARTGLLWNYFMQNPEIQPALTAIGFQPDFVPTKEAEISGTGLEVYPIPAATGEPVKLQLYLSKPQTLTAVLCSLDGRTTQTLFADKAFSSGQYVESIETAGLEPGVYWISVQQQNQRIFRKIVIARTP